MTTAAFPGILAWVKALGENTECRADMPSNVMAATF